MNVVIRLAESRVVPDSDRYGVICGFRINVTAGNKNGDPKAAVQGT